MSTDGYIWDHGRWKKVIYPAEILTNAIHEAGALLLLVFLYFLRATLVIAPIFFPIYDLASGQRFKALDIAVLVTVGVLAFGALVTRSNK